MWGKGMNVGRGVDGMSLRSSGPTKYQVFVPTSWMDSESIGAQCRPADAVSFWKFDVKRLFIL